MSQEQNKEAETFAIVVLGAMNPLIHHPAWYASVGALSEGEAEKAMAGEMVCVDQFSRFVAGEIEIACELKRWQIVTRSPALVEHVEEIVKVVFDKALTHTPVAAFGLNFSYHRSTSSADVSRSLTEMIGTLPLGLGDQQPVGARIAVEYAGDGEQTTLKIEPSVRDEACVYVSFNVHCPTAPAAGGVPEPFDLGVLIADRLAKVRPTVALRLSAVVAALNKAGGS